MVYTGGYGVVYMRVHRMVYTRIYGVRDSAYEDLWHYVGCESLWDGIYERPGFEFVLILPLHGRQSAICRLTDLFASSTSIFG